MEMTRLKGGSLSGTYLCRPADAPPFVRKDVSLVTNREYGFQRWYSQMKRLQRYSVQFPGVFPRLLRYGQDGDSAYFDLEYIPEAVTVQAFLLETDDRARIDAMFEELVRTMHVMHRIEIPSTPGPMDLYIHEEIEERLAACAKNARFQEIASRSHVTFNGTRVPGLAHVVSEFKALARQAYVRATETFTHGNLTLENVLYQPASNRIVFVDPYEENVIDSVLAEYSQVYQSSHARYELYNDGVPAIDGDRIGMRIPSVPGLDYFDERFTRWIAERHDVDERRTIRLLEVSQFVRMLPFKMEIDEEKMVFFYGLASYLFQRLRDEWDQAM